MEPRTAVGRGRTFVEDEALAVDVGFERLSEEVFRAPALERLLFDLEKTLGQLGVVHDWRGCLESVFGVAYRSDSSESR